ncbi:mas-related G-protein coupled receptor member X2-like isoform X1 [Ochotona curzoniae]|uniref:mas-related G-protein coupled receptor member X2-like isoform X1 n=1 Tax=Ochotona curzoniae TaxID=130825 RepID=UPI001B34EF15|nr:mas-related G-protein coupled receptor member X2-like isoform X1 [Ochotona curzoniae]
MVLRDTTGGFLSMNSSIPAQLTEITTLSAASDKAFRILYWLILGIALVGILGNGTVFWFLGFHMHKNTFYTYILHLTVADFLFLCCQVVDSLMFLTGSFPAISMNTPESKFLITMEAILYLVDLGILSTISAERCLSVLWPIWYRCHRHKSLSTIMCALIWALSLPLGILEVNSCLSTVSYSENIWCQIFNSFAAAWLLLLFLILCGSSLALLLRVRSSQRLPMTRLYVTILLTVLVFVLCGLPCGITWIYLMGNEIFSSNYSFHFQVVTFFLSCVNSSANPIIYFFVGSYRLQQRGQSLKEVLQRALQDTPEVGDSGHSLPQRTVKISVINQA